MSNDSSSSVRIPFSFHFTTHIHMRCGIIYGFILYFASTKMMQSTGPGKKMERQRSMTSVPRTGYLVFLLATTSVVSGFLSRKRHSHYAASRRFTNFKWPAVSDPKTTDELVTSASTEPSSTSTSNPKIQHRDGFDRASWEMGYSNPDRESCYQLKGDFPVDISGTFFQNGHAKFQVGDEQVMHPFDADGMITACTFHKGKAWFRNRFVETPGYLEESRKNRICYRGIFGTAKNKGAWYSNIFDLRFKNVANTHVLYRGGRIFALWEAGMPFELDPVTLQTIGESDLDKTLKPNSRYAAHYKIDPRTGSVCNFSNQPGKKDPLKTHTLEVMEHDQNGKLLYKKAHDFDCVGVMHDMAITEKYFIFLHSSVSIDPLPFVLGQKGIAQCIEFDNDAPFAQIVLVPRGEQGEPIAIDIPNSFTFHYCNAFEDEQGNVIVDICLADSMLMADTSGRYPDRPMWEMFDLDQLVPYDLRRLVVNPDTAKLLSITGMTKGCKSVDFPVVHPNFVSQPYRYAYCLGTPSPDKASPLQAVVKVDVQAGKVVEKWLPEPHQFPGELSFAPRSENEDDGYLIGYMMDAKKMKTLVVVFDAQNISQGPVSTVELEDFLPFALHGTFVPGFIPEFAESS